MASPKVQDRVLKLMMKEMLTDAKYNSRPEETESSSPVQIPQEINSFMYEMIILPYASYLLKSISQIESDEEIDENQQVWRIINSLGILLKISESFGRAMRYFPKKLGKMVLMLIEVFHFDIHAKYAIVF